MNGRRWQPALRVQSGLPALQVRQERGLGELLGQPGAMGCPQAMAMLPGRDNPPL